MPNSPHFLVSCLLTTTYLTNKMPLLSLIMILLIFVFLVSWPITISCLYLIVYAISGYNFGTKINSKLCPKPCIFIQY